jgi:hypothetical protein
LEKPNGNGEAADGAGEKRPGLDLFEVVSGFDRDEGEENEGHAGAFWPERDNEKQEKCQVGVRQG